MDLTYSYNWRDPLGGVTPLYSYTAPHDTFLLNAVHLALTGGGDPLAYVVEVDVGSDAKVTSGDDDFDLQEAYVTHVSPSGFGVRAGKFTTFEGIEVIESGGNPTISRGFLFGLAEPFTHVGALLTYRFDARFDVAAGVVNGWDVTTDNNRGKTAVVKLGYTGDGTLVTASGTIGPERAGNADDLRGSGDVTGMVQLGPVALWAQANAGIEEGAAADGTDAAWWGVGVQPVLKVLDALSIGARAEALRDRDGARTGADQTLYNLTVTPGYTAAPGLVVRAELRADWSSEDVFPDEDGILHDSQWVAAAEAIYAF